METVQPKPLPEVNLPELKQVGKPLSRARARLQENAKAFSRAVTSGKWGGRP
jgi:hypothetical protein